VEKKKPEKFRLERESNPWPHEKLQNNLIIVSIFKPEFKRFLTWCTMPSYSLKCFVNFCECSFWPPLLINEKAIHLLVCCRVSCNNKITLALTTEQCETSINSSRTHFFICKELLIQISRTHLPRQLRVLRSRKSRITITITSKIMTAMKTAWRIVFWSSHERPEMYRFKEELCQCARVVFYTQVACDADCWR